MPEGRERDGNHVDRIRPLALRQLHGGEIVTVDQIDAGHTPDLLLTIERDDAVHVLRRRLARGALLGDERRVGGRDMGLRIVRVRRNFVDDFDLWVLLFDSPEIADEGIVMIDLPDIKEVRIVEFALVFPLTPSSGKWKTADYFFRFASAIFCRRKDHKLAVQVLAQSFVLRTNFPFHSGIRAVVFLFHRRKEIIAFHHSLQ